MTAPAFHLHLAHRLWRRLPVRQRRSLVTWGSALLAPRIDRAPPRAEHGIAIAGEFSRASGLGEGARLLQRGLEHAGMRNWTIDIGGLLPAHTPDFPATSEHPPAGAPLILHVNPPLLPLVLFRLPRELVRGRRIIGYWLWELPKVPSDWHAGARFVHEVWVPSGFVADAVEPLLPGRVRIVPFPLSVARPQPSNLDRAAFSLPPDAVVVLVSFNLASSFERKNPLAAIAAFRAAFGNRTDRLLVMKIGNRAHAPDDFARIVDAVGGAPNIRLETRTLPSADLHALTVASDIVMSLHRSEGFGLVLAEAMLLGKPVVATGWSGNMAFMDANSAALVDYHLVAAGDARQVYTCAEWAEVDQVSAVQHLRRLAGDAAARQALGAKGQCTATTRLGITAMTQALCDLGMPPL